MQIRWPQKTESARPVMVKKTWGVPEIRCCFNANGVSEPTHTSSPSTSFELASWLYSGPETPEDNVEMGEGLDLWTKRAFESGLSSRRVIHESTTTCNRQPLSDDDEDDGWGWHHNDLGLDEDQARASFVPPIENVYMSSDRHFGARSSRLLLE